MLPLLSVPFLHGMVLAELETGKVKHENGRYLPPPNAASQLFRIPERIPEKAYTASSRDTVK